MKKVFILIFFGICCLLLVPSIAFAQTIQVSLGAAVPVRIAEENVPDGSIISSQEGGGFVLSTIEYDPFLYGVVTLDPALYLYDKAAEGEYPAVSEGKIYVRVSTANGNIVRGDAITSSEIPGVGVKATDNGFVLGYAEEPYEAASPDDEGKILVTIDPHFAQLNSNIFNTLTSLPRMTFSATPLNLIRYFLAGLVGVISFYVGFRFFGRASLEGVQAMGRNPLAKQAIIFMVVINAGLTVGVMLIGLFVSYLILVI
ncbi:MAG TPA: hypothetical protein VLF20_05325 [Patescibacteria group bacterium]|nr:hypothetical protein [Patescibacteria group bacterium]